MSTLQKSRYFSFNIEVSTAFSTVLVPISLREVVVFMDPVFKQFLDVSISRHLFSDCLIAFILFIRKERTLIFTIRLKKKVFYKEFLQKVQTIQKNIFVISMNFSTGYQQDSQAFFLFDFQMVYCFKHQLINLFIIYFLQAQMGGCCFVDSCLENQQKKYHYTYVKKETIQSSIVPVPNMKAPQNTMYHSQRKITAKTPAKSDQSLPIHISTHFPAFSSHRSYGSAHQTHPASDPSLEYGPYRVAREPNFIEKTLQESFANDIQEEEVRRDEPLNPKFDNSVRDSVVLDKIPQQQIDYEQLLDNGLPNIGNTCYLNSVLQMLYSADKFREIVIKLSQKPQLVFHQLIARVFLDIKDKSPMDMKQNNIQSLVYYIQKKQARFVRYSQNDALESLLYVLNMLEDQYPACSKLNYFKTKYQMRCGCKNFDGIIEDYCVKSNQFCIRCKSNVSYLIQNTGPYLIILPNPQAYRFKRFIKFINKDKNHIYYQQKSLITHFGTRNSGHYISHRRVNKKWIRISDSNVRVADDLAKYCEVPKITLYQFARRSME